MIRDVRFIWNRSNNKRNSRDCICNQGGQGQNVCCVNSAYCDNAAEIYGWIKW